MKSTILNLKERVLVVEGIYENREHKLKFICKGSELSEEIAKGFTKMTWINDDPELCKYKNYNTNGNGSLSSALDSFISAIETNGYYWSENPIEEPTMDKYGWYASGSPYEDSGWMYEEGEEKYHEALKDFEEAESKTFHPEQVILFEIV